MMKPIDLERRAEWLSKAGILTEALPFMRRYNDKTVVVKYGGHAMGKRASECLGLWRALPLRGSPRHLTVQRPNLRGIGPLL